MYAWGGGGLFGGLFVSLENLYNVTLNKVKVKWPLSRGSL